MFSLIITIISIALVAALALATIFYGGDALNKGSAQAEATKLLNQSQQILGASDVFRADHSRWPYDLQELVNTGYLRTIPVSQLRGGALRIANAEEDVLGQWSTPLRGRPVYVAGNISAGVCSKVNLMTMKVDAVYAGLVPEVNSQCFASGSGYQAVASREWPAIPEAFPAATVASGMPAPTDAGWVVVEGRVLNPSGAGGDVGEGGSPTGAPVLAVSSLQHDFGARPLGTVNPVQLTVRNTGTAALTFNNAPALSGDHAFAFTSTNCGAGLAPGDECTVELSFTPAALAQASGSLAIDTNATASPTVVQLSGSGLGAATTLSSDSLVFGAQNVGSTTSLQLTVRNEGNVAFDFTQAPAVSGNGAFRLASTTCGTSLAGGAQCVVTVTFSPSSINAAAGSLTFAAAGAPYDVSLSGSGLAALARYENGAGNQISSLDFPATSVGSNATPLTLTVRNAGNVDLVFTGAFSAPAPYSIAASTCTDATLPPDGACSVTVTFSPPAAQSYSGPGYVLSYSSSAHQPGTAALTGMGSIVGVASISGGGVHTAVVRSDGSLWTTGHNTYGQLGDGTNTQRTTFAQVLTGVSSVHSGGYFTAALKTDGTVWTTGQNNEGQLADGTTANRNSFAKIFDGASKLSVAPSGYHMLAAKADGSLWVAGVNWNGQLGDGTYSRSTVFKRVTFSGAAAVFAGGSHSLVLKSDGTLWGAGLKSAIGTGSGDQMTFAQVLTGVASVGAGGSYSLAVKTDGTLQATGANSYGQLGRGNTTSIATWAAVSGVSGVSRAVAGAEHSVLLLTNGTLWTAGSNTQGQLGEAGGHRNFFKQILTGVSAVAAGNETTLALKADETLWVSGSNGNGQLGDGTTASKSSFIKVLP